MSISRKTPRTRTITSSQATDLKVALAQLDIWMSAYTKDERVLAPYLNLIEARRALATIRAGMPAKMARQLKDDALLHIAYALGITKPKTTP